LTPPAALAQAPGSRTRWLGVHAGARDADSPHDYQRRLRSSHRDRRVLAVRPVTDQRLATLRAALGFLQLAPRAPELRLLHRWLDTWAGLGLITVGLHRVGWDLQLTQYGDGHWRATFYVTGQAHSIVGGSAWEPTPWRAVQIAASTELHRAD
jgi:hypothetical protein